MALSTYGTSQKLALAGGLVAVAGAFLPWITAGSESVPGYATDGFLVLMFGVTVVGVVLVREWTLLEWIATTLFGGLAALFPALALVDLVGTTITIGVGIPVQLVGGLLAVAGGSYATVEVETGGDGQPLDGGREDGTFEDGAFEDEAFEDDEFER